MRYFHESKHKESNIDQQHTDTLRTVLMESMNTILILNENHTFSGLLHTNGISAWGSVAIAHSSMRI